MGRFLFIAHALRLNKTMKSVPEKLRINDSFTRSHLEYTPYNIRKTLGVFTFWRSVAKSKE